MLPKNFDCLAVINQYKQPKLVKTQVFSVINQSVSSVNLT